MCLPVLVLQFFYSQFLIYPLNFKAFILTRFNFSDYFTICARLANAVGLGVLVVLALGKNLPLFSA